MRIELIKSFFAEAAHCNPNGNEAQRRLHGHSYQIDLVAEGEVLTQEGWLIDFGDIRDAFHPFFMQIDHHDITKLEGLAESTVKGLARWLEERIKPKLPCLKRVQVSIVGDCKFKPIELPCDLQLNLPSRIRFTFEAAQAMLQLPEGHPCRNLHGHSYCVEIGAKTEPATLMPVLENLYEILDHRYLNEIPGLEYATVEFISKWIWDWLIAKDVRLTAVVVQETATARCIYRGTV